MATRTEITKSIRSSIITIDDLRQFVDQLLDAPGDTHVRVDDNHDHSPGNHECRIEVTYEVET